jgi:filamentous hemagglutinin family protein
MAGDALPTNPNVASGDVSVATSGSAMTISQGSDRAIVNWQGFSIGEGNTVNIHQPGVTSAILNRVTGSTSSTIAGALNANGQVLLINPNGIAITSTGAVSVGGGFVGSTLDILDEDFLKGDLTFKGKGASASITNEGVITVGSGGYAALLGGSVRNDGRIAVPLGKVGLGAGERITLDLSGDGFMQVALPSSGKDSLQALVDNGGTLSADGGYVILAAATAQELARKAINMDGLIQARTVSGQNGAIVLGGGAGGTTSVSGTLDASGVTGTGGSIAVTGQTVALTGATLDASGARGGGSVRVGGDWGGEGTLPTAKTTTVDAATTLKADATVEGDGGSVVLWSDKQTTFQGAISARGAGAGKGGDAEVSGKAKLTYQGFADLSSDKGAFGTLLLDPYNVTISNGTDTGGVTASGDDSVINVSTLQTALAGANVTVSTGTGGSQNGDITLANALSWSANTTLTLAAAGAIAIDANLTASGTNAGLVLTTGTGQDYSIASGASITLSGSGATLAINGTTYTLIHDMAALDAIDTTGLSGAYALAGNLDASGTTYDHALVGLSGAQAFTGTFAGLGNTISNLTITNTAATTGFFGLFGVNRGSIRDIGLEGGSVTLEGNSADLIAGRLAGYNLGTISNAHASGNVSVTNTGSFDAYAGGFVGGNGGTITNAYGTGDVSAEVTGSKTAYAGGLVATNIATITNASATGTASATGSASGEAHVGGLVGYHYTGTISNAHATGAATATGDTKANAGGLVGTNESTITNAYATGAVKATGSTIAHAGGLVGTNDSTITNAYATGAVTAMGGTTAYAGGLMGRNEDATISNAYATGAVTATASAFAYAGGLAGTNYFDFGTITNAYATGNVQATTTATGIGGIKAYAGGLVGQNFGILNQAYATGIATSTGSGTSKAGGFVGGNNGTITASYWDTDTSGLTTGVDSGSSSGVTGLTTKSFQDTNGFMTLARAAGWDFETTWAPPSSGYYPQLYALTPVLYVEANDIGVTYGDDVTSSNLSTTYGGSDRYVFGPSGDTVAARGTTTASATSNVGSYAITAPSSARSSKGVTYRVVTTSGTVTVSAREITVSADDMSRILGDPNPTFPYGITSGSLVNGDRFSGALASLATTRSPLGIYGITLGSLALSGNYNITFLPGTLTIAPPARTTTQPPPSIIANQPFTDAPNATDHLRPQFVFSGRAANGTGSGSGSGDRTIIEDPRLSGPVCFMGTEQALSCGAS